MPYKKRRQAVADLLTIPRGKVLTQHEQRDIHEIDEVLGNYALFDKALRRFADLRDAHKATGFLDEDQLAQLMGRPRKVKTIKHMGAIWDYRGFTIPNGPRITPLVHVEHIPVVPNVVGRADLDTLWRVLIAQGLMVHTADDAEGNVAFYTHLDRLNYQARGANSLSWGTEHMHYTVTENWTSRQLNSAAYLRHLGRTSADVPFKLGMLGAGSGSVSVRRRGQVSHEEVSKKAGFFDRSDPGEKFMALHDEINHRASFYSRWLHF